MSSGFYSEIMATGEKLKAIRTNTVSFVDGKPVHIGEFNFSVTGSVQPLGGKDLLLVPEGDRTKEQYWIFTTCEIRLNDTVIRNGRNFQVQTVENWGSYNRARIMADDVGPKSPN